MLHSMQLTTDAAEEGRMLIERHAYQGRLSQGYYLLSSPCRRLSW